MWFRVLLVVCLGVTACAGETWSLRTRSAADLECPVDDVKIYKLDERAYRAIGCKQAATYISICDATRKCTWAMDSASSPAAKEPPKPTTVAGCSFDAQCKGERFCVK